MEKKKLAAISLLIAIALSMFGFVYAAWRDYVTISGTVNMGSLTLAFSDYEPPGCREMYRDPNTGNLVEGEWEGKDVGNCTAYYDPESYIVDEHTGKDGYKTLVILIDNAYPQYRVHTTFIVHNIGTIPLFLYGINFAGEKIDSGGAVVYDLIASWRIEEGDIVGEIYEDVDGSGDVTPGDILVINFVIKNGSIPIQLHPCEDEKMEIDIEFTQEAEECHTYLLYFELLGVQWNKLGEVFP